MNVSEFEVPPGVVTVTLMFPAAPAGDTHTISSGETTMTLVAAWTPKATVAPETKLTPLRMTDVPPDRGPPRGTIEVRVEDTAVEM